MLRIIFQNCTKLASQSQRRTMARLLAIALCVTSVLGDPPLDRPIVSTPLGSLRGSVMKSLFGRDIFSFRGVRYAKPPTGALRFQPPEPVEPWTGVQDATDDGAGCSQGWYPGPKSEDCLFLNAYTTQLPGDAPLKRPVYVWFHSGAWSAGTGTSVTYGPQYLMDRDIVVVTANYRLGALGFLSTGDDVLPGNYGMKDQVAVLRWVQQNIASFGGDPDCVTIGGNSAGGASVWFHLMSPMSRGLFHRAIAESPSITTFWSLHPDPLAQAQKQAALLNCPTDSPRAILDCIKNKTAQEFVDSEDAMYGWNFDPVLVFMPVLERSAEDENAFMVANPRDLLLSGNFHKVPLLIGVTRDEFAGRAWDLFANATLVKDMDQRWEAVAPISFMYEQGTELSRRASRRLRQTYLHGLSLGNSSIQGLGQIYADSVIIFGADRAAKMISATSPHPVFFYRFNYLGRFSYNTPLAPPGVAHSDDVLYRFPDFNYFPQFNSSDPEVFMVKRLTTMWSNFMKTGNPTSEGCEVIWSPLTPGNLQYLDIGAELVMQRDLYQDRMAIWNDLFPLDTTTEARS